MCALAAILFIPPGREIGEMGKYDDGHRVSITMPIVACGRAQQVGKPIAAGICPVANRLPTGLIVGGRADYKRPLVVADHGDF